MVPGWFRVVLANLEGVRGARIAPYDSWAHNFEVCRTQRLPQLESDTGNGPFGCPGLAEDRNLRSESSKKSRAKISPNQKIENNIFENPEK